MGTEEIISLGLEQKEKVKLMRMSKGYQWEISLLGNPLDDAVMKRLTEIDSKLRETYGGGE